MAGEYQNVWTVTSLCPQITLDLENSGISTKGTKSGAFVMYNCARLATLFDTYHRAVEQGEHQPLHPPLSCSWAVRHAWSHRGFSGRNNSLSSLTRHIPTSAASVRTELLLPAGRGE